MGDYARGWPLWRSRPQRLASPLHATSFKEWRGEDLSGRSIILVGEQGLGDEIMFSRYVPLVKRCGPSRLTLACRPENLRAMQHLGADEVIDRLSTSYLRPTHYWIQLGSLPEILATTVETVPPPAPPPVAIHRGGGVGFVANGNPALPTDVYRSLPPGASLPGAKDLAPRGDMLNSFEQVATLDLLATVDTSWAHVGGTLGKPVWLLLPKLQGLDWRWMHARPDSPWYPSVRIFRQAVDGDWQGVLDEVAACLVRPADD